jgi:hypothetical protein
MTKEEITQMYHEYLSDEGYMPRVDQSGNVVFKYEGGTYVILVSEKDDEFFSLVFPNFWSIEGDTERVKAILAAQAVNAETKVAKVFLVHDNTWASIEMFCCPPENFKTVFRRSLKTLRGAVANFATKMME